MRKFTSLLFCLATPLLLVAKPPQKMFNDPVLEEMRIDLEDLKHLLKTTQVELNLLDEQVKKQLPQGKQESVNQHTVEKKIQQLEKTVEKALNDLRALNTQYTQILTQLQTLEQQTLIHQKKLDEVVKLKSTLTQISKAIGQSTPSITTSVNYRVKAGDSLEKIARTQNTSVDTLKKLNKLSNSDKIFIGQELKLRDE